jgi:transketolase
LTSESLPDPAADPWPAEVRRVAGGIRRRVLAHVLAAGGGYLSQACSAADMLATLYVRLLRLGPSEGPPIPEPFAGVPGPGGAGSPSGARYNGAPAADRDRFFFSPVHYALVLYSALIEVGRMGPEGLAQFNQDGTTVEMIGAEHSPGHEVTGGSLAQTLSQAGGVALARKLRGDSGRVWVFMSDGEFQEGQTWETFAALGFHGLGNVTVLVDANGQQCDGAMAGVGVVEPLAERLRAFGAHAVEVDGHDVEALVAAAADPPADRPLVLIGRTDPCRGLAVLRDRAPSFHYLRFRSEAERARYQSALAALAAPAAPDAPPGSDARVATAAPDAPARAAAPAALAAPDAPAAPLALEAP